MRTLMIVALLATFEACGSLPKYEGRAFEVQYLVESDRIEVADRIVYTDFEGIEYVFLDVHLPFSARVQTDNFRYTRDMLVPNFNRWIEVKISKENNPNGGDLTTLATLVGTAGSGEKPIHHKPGTSIYQTGGVDLAGYTWVNDFSNLWGQN